MSEYYEKKALINHLQHRLYECAMNNDGEAAEIFAECAKNRVDGWFIDAPTADVRPLVRGAWMRNAPNSGTRFLPTFSCSICGISVYRQTKFCPHCGADMRKEI